MMCHLAIHNGCPRELIEHCDTLLACARVCKIVLALIYFGCHGCLRRAVLIRYALLLRMEAALYVARIVRRKRVMS